MDIVGKETLENMLAEYEGTVIAVSHDRYFINKVADRLLAFGNGEAKFYPYGYSEYEAIEREREEKEQANSRDSKSEKNKRAEPRGKLKKGYSTPLKERGKKERRAAKLEELIKRNEEETEKLNGELADPGVYSDYVKVGEIEERLNVLREEADAFAEEWLELTEFLDNER